ncbi:ParB/Srx family N-terminal domain-containing protein [Peribacillus deserti]|uniref:Uncharacterized protein n=1 Tax=Peribacillus deserti TaxID=673318 RepID=A0A2N5M1F4_9BACI|nr:ParB/RepB/Spo0J family partition protein [Peribacillus deserti]PLT28196.1 hypothetical protein CUU66_19835 [Peribacillus deserti]
MTVREVYLENLIWDLNDRINPDLSSMEASMNQLGLLSPLTVEGPNDEGFYYLIDGYRRYLVLRKKGIPNQTIPVNIVSIPTSRLERQTKRFHMHNTAKKIIGAEEQFEIDDIQLKGLLTDQEMIDLLKPKKHRVKRMEKSLSIDPQKREEVAKVRGSQHALEVLYSLDITDTLRSELYRMILNRGMTGEHGDALKKIGRHQLFASLYEPQKNRAIDQTMNQARFTNKEAELILLSEIMKDNPGAEPLYINQWLTYLIRMMEELSNSIHDDVSMYVTEIQKKQLASLLGKIISQLNWVWERPYESDMEKAAPLDYVPSFYTETTETGFRIRKH